MMNSADLTASNNNGQHASTVKSLAEQDKNPTPPSSISFSQIINRIVMDNKSSAPASNRGPLETEKKHEDSNSQHPEKPQKDANQNSQPSQPSVSKKACRAPASRKFAHPCACSQSNNHHSKYHSNNNNNSTGPLPPAAYTFPPHLFDPATKKCLPTSRGRDMLLKECRLNVQNPYPLPHQLYHQNPCFYDDLVCDARRNRCVCKPSLHLYYESNLTTFGCVPIGSTSSPDGRVNCKLGHVYNVKSKECQKIFDVSELPPYTTGVSATQFSFVTIVLIWILLLILIVTAKLRKLRSSNLYRGSPGAERRLHRVGSYRHQSQSASAWLHPFIAAVNGHHHLNHHRTTVDRNSQALDDSGNYTDRDFFLNNSNRRLNGILTDDNFSGSQQSLNNPPPKFEEIYPSCPEEQVAIQTPANEDLPSYDEAMKLQNTVPPDMNPNPNSKE